MQASVQGHSIHSVCVTKAFPVNLSETGRFNHPLCGPDMLNVNLFLAKNGSIGLFTYSPFSPC